MNMSHLIEWSARRHRDRIAFVAGDREFTYGEVDARSTRLASGLIELGVSKGDRVGILIDNRPEYFEAEFAVAKAGGVRVPMLTSLTEKELGQAVGHTGVKVMVASEGTMATVRSVLARLDWEVPVIVIGSAEGSEHEYEAVVAGAGSAPFPDLLDDDLYAIRVTGGTTGVPKAVAMSHRCMVTLTNNMLLNWPISTEDVVASIHPLSHASGMISYPYWARGAKNVIRATFRFDPEAFLAAVEQHRITSLFMIPTILTYLLGSPALDRYDRSTLRSVIYGGAPIPLPVLRRALEHFGPVFIQVYGTTEAPLALTTLMPDEHFFPEGDETPSTESSPPRIRSAGRTILNVEVRVVLPDGSEAEPGQVGEVISRGPHTMDGYWGNEELTKQRLRDGWVYTGDIGRFDEDGYLYIVDRKDDMIITGGFNVWPSEVEDVICEHPEVREAVVFGVEHERWGEAVAAVVVPRSGRTVEERSIIDYLSGRLARYKVPKCVVMRSDHIPTSAVGKALRRKAREEHMNELQTLLHDR